MSSRPLLLAVAFAFVGCQSTPPPADTADAPPPGPAPGSPEWKIENAMSAAPSSVSAGATIMDWPASEGAEMAQLRAGTNGWTCLSDMPQTPQNDPLCVDAEWLALFDAWAGKKPFTPTTLGISYMLQGGAGASDSDPYKDAPDEGEDWLIDPPHLMLIVPNVEGLGLPSNRSGGGPYIMWKGTPYAHVMVPVK